MDLQELKTVFRYGVIVIFISILIACKIDEVIRLPYYDSPDFTPLWYKNVPHSLHTISSFAFIDQNNNPISDADFKDKIYVANFFFTSCPSICPKMTKNMKAVADSFRNNEHVKFVSFSVDPQRDSAARLKLYANQYDIDDNQWHILTGNKADIYSLARKSYFAEEDIGFNKDSTEFLHTEHLLLVDRKSHLRGIYNGTLTLEMQRLQEDIKILLQE